MGRRSDHTREELKELAVNTAYDISAVDGLAGLSARKVASRMGYTAGTLYNLFENFDGLVVIVNARILDELYEDIKTAGSLKELALAYLGFAARKPNLWALLFEHHLPPDQVLPAWFQDKITRLFKQVEKVLLLEYPGCPAPERASKAAWAAVHGIVVLAHSNKLRTVQAESPETLVNYFFDRYRLV